MKLITARIVFVLVMMLSAVCTAAEEKSGDEKSPAPLDLKKAEAEVKTRYAKAHPEIQEYVRWTVRRFGPGGL